MLTRVFLLLILTVLSTISSAAIVAFNYTGTGENLLSPFDEPVKVSGVFGYDTEAVDVNPSPSIGDYVGGFASADIYGGPADGASYSASNLDVLVTFYSLEPYNSFHVGGDLPGASGANYIEFEFYSGDNVFLTDSLPETLNLFDFSYSRRLVLSQSPGFYVFEITSITPAVIPVPPALWLFGSGILGLIGWSRRRKTA